MGLKYRIIKDKKTVYVHGDGVITFADLMRHLDDLLQDRDYVPPMKKLIDYRTIRDIALSTAESELFAHKKASLNKRFSGEKCAIVSPAKSAFGVARVHETLIGFRAPSINTRVFQDFGEAQEWLGIHLTDDERTID